MGQSIRPSGPAEAEWVAVSLSEPGFKSDLEALLDKATAEKRVWNLHGVVIMRDGRLVLERYFEGEDNARGTPLGKVAFKADTLHDLRSVSKSIVDLLYGIALADRKGAAAGGAAPCLLPRIRRTCSRSRSRAVDDPSRADDDDGDGLGRARRSLFRSDEQRDRHRHGA